MTVAPHKPTLLERLAMAQAAPRCGANRKGNARACRSSGYVKRAVSLSWRK